MIKSVSKSYFKPRALEIFREVEASKESIIITDHGRPVLKIVPFTDEETSQSGLDELRNTLEKYDRPFDPVAENDWEILK